MKKEVFTRVFLPILIGVVTSISGYLIMNSISDNRDDRHYLDTLPVMEENQNTRISNIEESCEKNTDVNSAQSISIAELSAKLDNISSNVDETKVQVELLRKDIKNIFYGNYIIDDRDSDLCSN